MTSWLMLAGAIASEVAGTLALKASHGFSRPLPSAIVVVGYVLSFWLLALVLRELPVGVVYAVWSAVGIIAVAALGAVLFGESLGSVRIVAILVIIAGVVLLEAAPA